MFKKSGPQIPHLCWRITSLNFKACEEPWQVVLCSKKVKAIDAFVGKTWNHLAFTVRSRYPFQHPKSHHLYLLGPMQVCRSKSAPEAQVCQLWEETYYGLRHPCKKQSNKSHTPGLTNTKALGCHPMSIFLIFFNAISVSTSIYFQSTHHPSTLRVGHVILVEYIFWNPPGELCYVKQVKTTVLTPVPSWRGWIPRKTGTKAQPITNRISVNTTSGGSNENCWMTICHSTSNRKPCLIGYRTSPW